MIDTQDQQVMFKHLVVFIHTLCKNLLNIVHAK